MDYKYTSHQVARNTRPDAVVFNRMYLVKSVKTLRVTYQIKLLAFKAEQNGTKLVLRVPTYCKFDKSLNDLIRQSNRRISREDY